MNKRTLPVNAGCRKSGLAGRRGGGKNGTVATPTQALRTPVIEFRCWYCNRRHMAPKSRIGERITCACQYPLRVPARNGGACRIKTGVDRFLEAAVYGGGGGLIGFCLGVLVLGIGGDLLRLYPFGLPIPRDWQLTGFLVLLWATLAVPTLIGALIGLLGGERGINWIGRLWRGMEDQAQKR
jgi:hypothetical protein